MQDSMHCNSCGADMGFETHVLAAVCPYCASPNLVRGAPGDEWPTPSFVIGFTVNKPQAIQIATRWLRNQRWTAPRAFARADPAHIRGLYLPAYVYSSTAHSTYSAQVGESYQDPSSDLPLSLTEWHPVHGKHAVDVAGVVVSASLGIPNRELEAIEPFDLHDMRRFTPTLIAGWTAEQPAIDADTCLAIAREEATHSIHLSIQNLIPGDCHKQLQRDTHFDQEHLELLLLPVWVLAVRWHPDQPVVRLLVNGQTGTITGKAPVSWLLVAGYWVGLAAVLGMVCLTVWCMGHGRLWGIP